jgi:hypothetical protein
MSRRRNRGARADDADGGAVDGVNVGGAEGCVVTSGILSASVFCSFSGPTQTLIPHQLTEYALKVIRIKDILILLEDRAKAGINLLVRPHVVVCFKCLLQLQLRYPRG